MWYALESYVTLLPRKALSCAELRKEKLYQEMNRKIAKGEKLGAENNKYYKKMKAYAEEHNGSPLYMRDEEGNYKKMKVLNG